MDLFYGEQYPATEVLGAPRSMAEYEDGTTQFIHTEQGLFLLGRIGQPPSWVSPINTEFPYFLTPESLWVFLELRHWVSSPLLPKESSEQSSHYDSMPQSSWGDCNERVCNALISRLKCINLLGCSDGSNMYSYLGQALLTSCGRDPNEDRWRLHYRLGTPLTRETWIRFGGYSHWLLVIGQNEFTIRSYEEAIHMIDSLWGKAAPTLKLTRYEGDILRAGVNQDDEAGIIYLSTRGHAVYSGPFERECEWVWFNDVEEYSVPAPTLISRQQALAIIRFYMTTGRPIGLPGYIN